MQELERALTADSAATPPSHILEALDPELIHRRFGNVPHTIYQELWHIAFWQQITLDWISGRETPFPASPSAGFAPVCKSPVGKSPDGQSPAEQAALEPWPQLCARFFSTLEQVAAFARNESHLDDPIHCTSRPGEPLRTMSIRDQLISLAAHNHYHFGRIVLLRQLANAWPPPTGGFHW